jgi:hypothetical protein
MLALYVARRLLFQIATHSIGVGGQWDVNTSF